MSEIRYDRAFDLPATREAAFAAWTDPPRLRAWFAEGVHVEPREGGAFAFWGRRTPWMPERTLATQRITAWDPARRLAFDWAWCGVATRVSLAFEPAGAGCRLAVAHGLDAPVLDFDPREHTFLLDDLWSLWVGNLREFLRSGKPALLPDYSPREHVELSIEIQAPACEVWKSLTDPAQMDRWLSESARVDLRPGGEYSFGWTNPADATSIGPSRLVEVDPPRRLVHDWYYSKDTTARTEWRLEPLSPVRTRLTVRQLDVRTPREVGGYTGGWAKFLLRARALHEGGELL